MVVVGGEAAAAGDHVASTRWRPRAPDRRARPPSTPTARRVIGYTSGTTADPKGVVHTHRTLGFEVRQLGAHQEERPAPT